jgi:FAD/FMN-containing dehydrogenase/Fe-S oxidoreductase
METHVRNEPNPLVIHSEPPARGAHYEQPPQGPPKDWTNEARDLAAHLMSRIEGEVRFDNGSRALYATDLSIYRQVPIGVVIPRSVEDVIATVAACRARGVPILGRGCGTSLAGQTCNIAVVIDFSKYMNRVLSLEPSLKTARVEPGAIRDELNDLAEEHHLTFAPDPATHKYCTLGGMIGNNSCGVHSVMGGKTVDNIEELEILTYDGLRMRVGRTSDAELEQIIAEGGRRGEIYLRVRALRDRYADQIRRKYPKIPRRVSGYNLDELLPENGFHVARALVGSESTCVIVLEAKARLMDSPPKRALALIGYPDIFQAGDDVAAIRSYGPIGLEAFQKHVLENMHRKGKETSGEHLLPEGDTWLLAEFGGSTQEEAAGRARDAIDKIRANLKGHTGIALLEDPGDQESVWHIRESGVGSSRVPNEEDAWPSWEDAAVAPEVLGDYLRDFYRLLHKYNYKWTIYGHFGDGCVHSRITFDLKSHEGVRNYRGFMTEAADLVVRYGGSLSGEHGDGQARAELLPKMFGAELIEAFREFKSIWDPGWKMNPGKVVDPYPLDSNLRISPDHKPRPVMTYFKFPEDRGSFALATERCFGVGKCRGLDGGTMCPSFMATREEMHTTRGRAHLLFEMLRGEAIEDGWRDEHVKEALDLCLACKGCKGDCPVSVDLATYKAEFLAHYYEGRIRPRSAYTLGLVDRWARIGAIAPRFTNFVNHTPVLEQMVKLATGISLKRQIPRFAKQTFRNWFESRPSRSAPDKVVLWPDTFNNYFLPHTAQAATEVLEAAGCEVTIPAQNVCCGRPLYDFGMLNRAKQSLRRTLKSLRPALRAGLPVVMLEPSCATVFRDELLNLLPDDEDARRLHDQTFMLGEFLDRRHYRPPRLERKAVVHGHCHQKAVLGMKPQENLLNAMGVHADLLDSGCCGMAGSFGFESEHYDISMKIGERTLLPKVRSLGDTTLIVSNGFSCREQIAQATDRRALHIAEVLQMAIHEGPDGPHASLPESRYVQQYSGMSRKKIALLSGIAGGLAALGVWAYRRWAL